MSDVVVTLPKGFRWGGYAAGICSWMMEGAPPGQDVAGEYEWTLGCTPAIAPGDRVYVCYSGRLIGFAGLVRVERRGRGCALIRAGGARAVTIDAAIPGFRGFRYRWWQYTDEKPLDMLHAFPELRALPVGRAMAADRAARGVPA